MGEWIKRLIGSRTALKDQDKKIKKSKSESPDVVDENKEPTVQKPARKKKTAAKTEKDLANERNEPYVSIIRIDLDPDNVGNGAFELDWNDKFVANLVRAGYKGKTDQQIVDQWFQEICRNVVLESFEQEQADPEARVQSARHKRDDGRTEFS